MSGPAEARQPSPDLFFETMNAYQRTAALKAAIELDLFTAIGTGAHMADALAQRLGVAQRGARILLCPAALSTSTTAAATTWSSS
jgi:hypothetical protein